MKELEIFFGFYRYTWFDANSLDKISRIHSAEQWTAKYSTNFGLCYSYSIPKYLKDAEVRDVTFYIKNSIDFYLSHPGQFLSWQVHSFPMRSKQQVYVETSHEVIYIYIKYVQYVFDIIYINCFTPNHQNKVHQIYSRLSYWTKTVQYLMPVKTNSTTCMMHVSISQAIR